MRTVIGAVVVVAVLAAPVLADWDLGDPHKMHYPQMPDEQYGVDVIAGPYVDPGTMEIMGFFLADDFRCAQSGPITDIHIWTASPADWINLGIYADIPAAQSPTGYSTPGDLLWQTVMAPTAQRLWAQVDEEFIDPRTGDILRTNTDIWQLNFLFDEADAFDQTAGEIYWLGVGQSFDVDGNGQIDIMDLTAWAAGTGFGWKSSADHWNDDAVYTLLEAPLVGPFSEGSGSGGAGVGSGDWEEMLYPPWHEYADQSLDLAFVITPEPATLALMGLGAVSLLRRKR